MLKPPHYTADQMWSRPNVDDYMDQLRAAYKLVKDGGGRLEDMQMAARKTIEDKFNEKTITDNVIKTITNLAGAKLVNA